MLHGKLYCSATWDQRIRDPSENSCCAVAIHQVGFSKSSKPEGDQFAFRQLAENTRRLLASLNIGWPVVIAHSTGGMLALHYAIIYPAGVRQLALVNPTGSEDWSAKGVASISIDDWYERELQFVARHLLARANG